MKRRKLKRMKMMMSFWRELRSTKRQRADERGSGLLRLEGLARPANGAVPRAWWDWIGAHSYLCISLVCRSGGGCACGTEFYCVRTYSSRVEVCIQSTSVD